MRIRNGTPYALWLRSPDSLDPTEHEKKYLGEEIKITYDTAPFSIYAHGAGELPVDVDFAMPNGVEVSPGSEVQKKRIRIRWDGPRMFEAETVSINETQDTYEFTLRYKVERKLSGAYLGDGVASNDGASIYVPLAEPPNVTNAKLLKVDANDLQTTAQASVVGTNIFFCPKSVAVLDDRVVAIFNREHMSMFDHDLKPKPALPFARFNCDILTNLKGSGPYIFTIAMKETPTSASRYNYKNESWFFLDEGTLHLYTTGASIYSPRMDTGRPSRVPGASHWVAPNTISPMDARSGSCSGHLC